VGLYEDNNETSGCRKCGEFLGQLSDYQLLKKGTVRRSHYFKVRNLIELESTADMGFGHVDIISNAEYLFTRDLPRIISASYRNIKRPYLEIRSLPLYFLVSHFFNFFTHFMALFLPSRIYMKIHN